MNCHSDLELAEREESKKMGLIWKALSIFTLLFILQACAPNTLEKEAPGVNEITAGEKFTIILPENHNEGLLWKLKDDFDKTITDNMGAVWHGNDYGIHFRFQSLKAGTDTLHLTQFKTNAVTKERDSVKSVTYIIKVNE